MGNGTEILLADGEILSNELLHQWVAALYAHHALKTHQKDDVVNPLIH